MAEDSHDDSYDDAYEDSYGFDYDLATRWWALREGDLATEVFASATLRVLAGDPSALWDAFEWQCTSKRYEYWHDRAERIEPMSREDYEQVAIYYAAIVAIIDSEARAGAG